MFCFNQERQLTDSKSKASAENEKAYNCRHGQCLVHEATTIPTAFKDHEVSILSYISSNASVQNKKAKLAKQLPPKAVYQKILPLQTSSLLDKAIFKE